MNWRSIRAAVIGAVACLAALVAAGPATADIRTFKVTLEGSGTYDRYDQLGDPFDGQLAYQNSVAASFSWRTTIGRISFDSETGKLVDGKGAAFGTLSGGGEQEQVVYGRSGDQIIRTPGKCEAAPEQVAVDGGRVIVDAWAPPAAEPGASLIAQPFDEVRLAATCEGGLAGHSRISIWDGSQPADAFDHHFFLPKEATDQALIIQHVDQRPSQAAKCALRVPATQTCTLQWSGKLTFELIEVVHVQPPPPANLDDLLLPLDPDPHDLLLPLDPGDLELIKPRKPALSPRGDKASVEVSCPGGCAGTVSAYAISGAKASSSASPPLATKRFKAPAGSARKVVLRFKGAARAAVREAGAVRLVVRVGKTRESLLARARR